MRKQQARKIAAVRSRGTEHETQFNERYSLTFAKCRANGAFIRKIAVPDRREDLVPQVPFEATLAVLEDVVVVLVVVIQSFRIRVSRGEIEERLAFPKVHSGTPLHNFRNTEKTSFVSSGTVLGARLAIRFGDVSRAALASDVVFPMLFREAS